MSTAQDSIKPEQITHAQEDVPLRASLAARYAVASGADPLFLLDVTLDVLSRYCDAVGTPTQVVAADPLVSFMRDLAAGKTNVPTPVLRGLLAATDMPCEDYDDGYERDESGFCVGIMFRAARYVVWLIEHRGSSAVDAAGKLAADIADSFARMVSFAEENSELSAATVEALRALPEAFVSGLLSHWGGRGRAA